MSPENFSAILGGLTDGVVGAVLGFLFGYLLFRLTQKRKLVEYSVSSISLLRLKPSTDSVLTVSVNKEALTGDPADHNEMLALNTVYGFQILLNVGNEDIDKIDDIEIRLDTAAKIVRCETDPLSTQGYIITTRKDPAHPNLLHLSVPYLNAKSNMVIRLITTENENSNCTVTVHGVGIQTRPARSLIFILFLGMAIFVLFMAVGLILILLDAQSRHLPNPPISPQGWVGTIFIVGGTVVYLCIGLLLFLLLKRRPKFSQDWDWKVPKAPKK